MSHQQQQKWNDCYQNANIKTATAATVLQQNMHLLPLTGQGLDLACGRAGNAQLLAKHGFKVDALDFSNQVVDALKKQTDSAIEPKVWNSETDDLATGYYDVVVVSYFLQRNLFPAIIKSLKTGGLLFYQTWSQLCVDTSGPSNPDYRLEQGELLFLCTDLRIILYREEGQLGDIQQGYRNEACLIAEKG